VPGYVQYSAWVPQPLSFLAQINLADVASQGCDLPLPRRGLLLFFYDTDNQPWGMYPHDSVGTQVLFVPAGTKIARGSIAQVNPSPVRPLRCVASESLPSSESAEERMKGQAGYSREAFDEDFFKLRTKDLKVINCGSHVFGGWPSSIQAPMEPECERVTNRIHTGNSKGRPRAAALRQSAPQWRLLLQLDSDDKLHWEWADVGRLYFWCRESDIAERRFERCWTVLQC
jgi:uncharacterized protein YwqG